MNGSFFSHFNLHFFIPHNHLDFLCTWYLAMMSTFSFHRFVVICMHSLEKLLFFSVVDWVIFKGGGSDKLCSRYLYATHSHTPQKRPGRSMLEPKYTKQLGLLVLRTTKPIVAIPRGARVHTWVPTLQNHMSLTSWNLR